LSSKPSPFSPLYSCVYIWYQATRPSDLRSWHRTVPSTCNSLWRSRTRHTPSSPSWISVCSPWIPDGSLVPTSWSPRSPIQLRIWSLWRWISEPILSRSRSHLRHPSMTAFASSNHTLPTASPCSSPSSRCSTSGAHRSIH
jgi:hypothetical protein